MRLLAEIAGYGPTLVTLSGGVDSSLVLAAAVRALGLDRTAAVTAVSPAVPRADRDQAAALAAHLGVRHFEVPTGELSVAGYQANGADRCYFCKTTLATAARALADELGWPAIATGTHADDLTAGFRPGIAAAAERGARTPLADTGIGKAGIRRIARDWGLPTWDRPAAPCLSSRVAYGIPISRTRLARIEAAEAVLRTLLPRVRDLRVRDLGDSARVEVDPGLVQAVRRTPGLREALAAFGDIPFEVAPFRSGSLNDLLP